MTCTKAIAAKNTNLNSPRIYNEVTAIRKKPDVQNHLNPPSATFSTKRVVGRKSNFYLQHFNENQKLIPMVALRLQITFYETRLATNQPSWRLSYLKHWMLFTYNVKFSGSFFVALLCYTQWAPRMQKRNRKTVQWSEAQRSCNALLKLNEFGHIIWQECNGKND